MCFGVWFSAFFPLNLIHEKIPSQSFGVSLLLPPPFSSQSINQITHEGLVFVKSTKLNGNCNFSHEKIILGMLHSENEILALKETQSKNGRKMSEPRAVVG